jgi:hypothetical protein
MEPFLKKISKVLFEFHAKYGLIGVTQAKIKFS